MNQNAERLPQGNFIGCMQFLEATHIVEIMREAGPKGASVKDIASKATEIRRAKDPKAPELDPAKISECQHAVCPVASLKPSRRPCLTSPGDFPLGTRGAARCVCE